MTVTEYMNEQFNFGGEMLSRAAIYRWYEENGYPRRHAELWLIGAELAKKRAS